MTVRSQIRKLVHFEDDVLMEGGADVSPTLRRVVTGAVVRNPLAGADANGDLAPLIELSEELGVLLTERALDRIGPAADLRAYGKAALVGTNGTLEHGAALIHPRLGMAMRRTLRRGKVLIPGNAKVASSGTSIDVILGPLDEGWDLDAMDTFPVLVPDAPRPDEFVLLVGYATGARPHARAAGPSQDEVNQLIDSFD